MGIRQKLAEEFGSSPNKEGKLGKQHADDVIVTALRYEDYHESLASSVFCWVFPGDGWSGRMEDSVLQGCIPVVIQVWWLCFLSVSQLKTWKTWLGFSQEFLAINLFF